MISIGFCSNGQFKVHQYRTWDDGSGPETFSETVGYYDDHGVLQQNRQYDFDKSQWNTTRYGFNNYGQITSTTDPLNHQTGYTWDEWNRLMSITDVQGNHQDYEYDIVNRTKKSSFVPQATGIAENHHLVGYDQWGREISRKGYPDGWGQANDLEETSNYDLLGNLVQATDPRGYTTQYQFDPLNPLVKVINPRITMRRVYIICYSRPARR